MSVLYLIPVWFILALLIPTMWSVSKVYGRSRGLRVVVCPETRRVANIELNSRYAVKMHVTGNSGLKIQYCSRWPERETCPQGCLEQVPRPA
jgi:hypothetical protein